MRHGEAVGTGLVFAGEVAYRMGRISAERLEHHREVVAGYDLPMGLPVGAKITELVGFMARDKKSDGSLTLVLDGPAGVEPVASVSPALVSELLEEMGGDVGP